MSDLMIMFGTGYIAVWFACKLNGMLFNKPHFFQPKKRIYPLFAYYLFPIILTLAVVALNDIFANIDRSVEFKFIFVELLVVTFSLLKFKDNIYETLVLGAR
ncbi:hypothetical protein SPONN_1354 [uncultured Candidatus Thioglobus sp.]|nr:hypothetical protein SPONN_1354 [uncultured Candidatus Thioglobus sp.]